MAANALPLDVMTGSSWWVENGRLGEQGRRGEARDWSYRVNEYTTAAPEEDVPSRLLRDPTSRVNVYQSHATDIPRSLLS